MNTLKLIRLNIATKVMGLATLILGDEEVEARWDMSDLAYDRMETEWRELGYIKQKAFNGFGE